MKTGAVRVAVPVQGQRVEQRLLQREAEVGEVRRVLGLRIDADLAAQPLGLVGHQAEDLVERRDVVAAVEAGVVRAQLR